jgi:hypothetical protein
MSNANESRRTVYPGAQLLHLWANDCARDLRGGNVSTSNGGATLWSYRAKIAHRFPGDIRAQGNARVYLMRSPFYSRTTAKHLSQAQRAIPGARFIHAPSGYQWNGGENLEAPGGLIDGAPALPVPVCSLGLDGGRTGGGGSVIFSGVICVDAENETQHRQNYAALHAAALAPLEDLKRAVKYGSPDRVACALAEAELYRRTFLPAEARLPIPADAPAIVAAWRARVAKREAREAAAKRLFERDVKAWADAYAPALAAVKAWHEKARAALSPMSIAEKVNAWESNGGEWPQDDEAPEAEQARRIVAAFIDGADVNDHRIPQSIRAALPSGLDFPMRHPMKRKGALFTDFVSIYMQAGVSRFSAPGWYGSSYYGAPLPAGRHLLRLSADGGEVITSGGARVPASIARLLWKRHGALMAEAVDAASVPPFPNADGAAIPFGPFAWTGWTEADANAREAGAGNWLLRVGCHLISPADLCRMAARHAWEGERHA